VSLGFTHAFTATERAQLALLHMFCVAVAEGTDFNAQRRRELGVIEVGDNSLA
jgi:hypothetical protein